MGVSKARRERFLAEHPYCCFCGGEAPNETEDHIPGRQFFSSRNWPEGFCFPACRSCNSRTMKAENFCAALSKMLRPWGSPFSEEEVSSALKAFSREFHSELSEMFLKPNEIRRYLRDHDLDKPNGFLEDTGMMRVPGAANRYIAELGSKLSCALHYRETGRIVRKDQPLSLLWFTNELIVNGQTPFPEQSIINRVPLISRGRKDFQEEFRYLWNANKNENLFAFIAEFGNAYCIQGGIFNSKRDVEFPLFDIFGNPLNEYANFN